MGKGLEQILLQRGHTDGQQTYEKIINITNIIIREIPYDFTLMWTLMNKVNEQGKWGQTRRVGRGEQVEGVRKKEKGLMEMDNSVVIAGGRVV